MVIRNIILYCEIFKRGVIFSCLKEVYLKWNFYKGYKWKTMRYILLILKGNLNSNLICYYLKLVYNIKGYNYCYIWGFYKYKKIKLLEICCDFKCVYGCKYGFKVYLINIG